MAGEWTFVVDRRERRLTDEQKILRAQRKFYAKHRVYDAKRAREHNARLLKMSLPELEIATNAKTKIDVTRDRYDEVMLHTVVKPTKAKAQALSVKRVHSKLTEVDVSKFAKILIDQCAAHKIVVEFIGKHKKKRTTLRPFYFGTKVLLKHNTRHEAGQMVRNDSPLRGADYEFLHQIVNQYDIVTASELGNFAHGSSGVLFEHPDSAELFSIRGRCSGQLINALTPTHGHLSLIDHYASEEVNARDFWRGYTDLYCRQRREAHDHKDHIAQIPVETCGRLAAIMEHVLRQSYKITCGLCSHTFDEESDVSVCERIHDAIKRIEEQNRLLLASDPALRTSLQALETVTTFTTTHHTACLEVMKTLDPTLPTPANRLVDIAKKLMQLKVHDGEAMKEIGDNLLEVTRWYAKRSKLSEKDEIATFKNKVPPRGVVGNVLTCDNQLDKNGNFLWGQRAYHAKRFLSNYYEIVDPTDGYDKHVIRKSPYTQRHLAIGKLVVTMDLAKMRERMRGLPIKPLNITQSCISKLNGNIVYPCSCVTQESGKALWSEFTMPTKEHISLGNAMDPQLVDMPRTDPPQMYIVKDGYCYLNIFLAMLIYVNEEDAKSFTKFIRDRIQPMLREWPTLQDVATACYLTSTFYPETMQAEIPKILIDHESKTAHVLDTFGSLTTNYHVLKANTVAQLVRFAYNDLESEMKGYVVGGAFKQNSIVHLLEALVKGIFNVKVMEEIIREEPFLLFLSIASPCVIMNMYNNANFERAMRYYSTRNMHLASLFAMMEALSQKVSAAEILSEQLTILETAAGEIHARMAGSFQNDPLALYVRHHLLVMMNRADMNAQLREEGHTLFDTKTYEMIEKKYANDIQAAWHALGFVGKLSALRQLYAIKKARAKCLKPMAKADLGGIYNISPMLLVSECHEKLRTPIKYISQKLQNGYISTKHALRGGIIRTAYRCLPDIFTMVRVSLAMSVTVSMLYTICATGTEYKKYKREALRAKIENEEEIVRSLHTQFMKDTEWQGTEEEFIAYIDRKHPDFLTRTMVMLRDEVEHQKKGSTELQLEQAIAFATLLTMLFDADRSDAVFRILQKIRSCTQIIGTTVEHQGTQVDEPLDMEKLKNLTVDFEVKQEIAPRIANHDTTFEKWWSIQITQGRTTTHYRNKGEFIEFSRKNAAEVCHKIAHSSTARHFLVKGNVGSGKSTGIPNYLCSRGKVLMLEPTRPLTENVFQQLHNEPWCLDPSMQMRGKSVFGSTPISVMTTGFALHLFANNVTRLEEFKFIIFDECHVLDANAMAFYCLLEEYNYSGKILSVSATPPGKETEFETEKPVDLRIFEDVSFDSFVNEQGSGSKLDATAVCDSILVYVASYNEVDSLSNRLLERGFSVTKVDGRTMSNVKSNKNPLATAIHDGSIKMNGNNPINGRKHFIVATNIIENGVTLNVDGVVDFGTKVVADLDVDNRAIVYNKVSISYGERVQRLGRVGRFKKGYAFRIGTTQKGIVDVPSMTATEAAFLCFAYGLPVITHNVSTTHLANVTSLQARTMLQFELPIFVMSELVKYDGHMHPTIHKILTPYKLRDSSITLRETALPQNAGDVWIDVQNYKKMGFRLDLADDIKIPYFVHGVSNDVYKQIWEAVKMFRSTCCMRRMTSSCAGKIAYTLQIDNHAIPRTLAIIDGLIRDERTKHNHFLSMSSNSTSSYNFTLNGIVDMLRSRYMRDHSLENIQKLEMVKNQVIEFDNAKINYEDVDKIKNFGSLQTVIHETREGVAKEIGLQDCWSKELMCKDGLIAFGVMIGGILIGWKCFNYYFQMDVEHQAKSKRSKQKLIFRDARDRKLGREVYGDDSTMDKYFGEAYTKKAKKGNKTHGMGAKTKRFCHVYGVDPTEYDMIRFVDPLTGITLDDTTQPDMELVQELFQAVRHQLILYDQLDKQHLHTAKTIHAYFIKHGTRSALSLDLTHHVSTLLCQKSNAIAGFPEREGELRQTGTPIIIDKDAVPKPNEADVEHEGVATLQGILNYYPISNYICILRNESDGLTDEMHGIGHGPYVIAPSPLFTRYYGSLSLRSVRGLYKIENTCNLRIMPVENRDIVIIRLPKDHPPFTHSIQFEEPCKDDKVVMLGMNFQNGKNIQEFSDSSIIVQQNESFWKHWIATKAGYCGLPLVSTRTKAVVGIHSLRATDDSVNYFTSVNRHLKDALQLNIDTLKWIKGWKYNTKLLSWDGMHLKTSKPSAAFNTIKEVRVVNENMQNVSEDTWLTRQLKENLLVVGKLPGNLVTKHVVKGKCQLFQLYLNCNEEANAFFKPLLGHYGKSKLNREAFIKDFTKYDKPILVGSVQTNEFEIALKDVIRMLHSLGMKDCNYVTIAHEIFDSMNMKAAVGALYAGKKREFFKDWSDGDKENLLENSCSRLFTGKIGVWNGSLKAELRPTEKLIANKTRTFTAAPLETLLGGKVCVDDFNNQFYSNHLKGPWTVGISKFYRGWDKLLRALPDGWIYCDADGSQFDSSLTPFLLNAVLRIRLACMEEWEIGEQMLRNLYTEIVYTPIATPDGSIIKKHKGNNSGQPSTVVDNTLMLILAFTYTMRVNNISAVEQNNIIRMYGNGDDLLIAVHPDFQHILDTMGKHFADLGLNFDFSSRTTNKEDLWFMSHKGVLINEVYIPKLEKERIVAILEWDRSTEPEHRLSAICAAIIESWGYDDLTQHIRKFYQWVLDQEPYKGLALQGKAPYLSESALKKLYLDTAVQDSELFEYYKAIYADLEQQQDDILEVEHQATEDAGVIADDDKVKKVDAKDSSKNTGGTKDKGSTSIANVDNPGGQEVKSVEKDVDTGTVGKFTIPKLKKVSPKMRLPRIGNQTLLNIEHLITYEPDQRDISNTRATHSQFKQWYEQIKKEYDVDDDQMQIILNGFMVWAIENGTSPNVNGYWVMMDDQEQVEYPLKPIVEHAKPTLRQCMMHFSDAAEAYIEMRNLKQPYMPRYGLLRNLNDKSLARFAFDFYEVTSRTPNRAREAHAQMKAASIHGGTNNLFGLDGNVGETSENTERHVATDVNNNTHSYRGAQL
nr:polyprotein [Canna yellow streak virus]